MKIIDKNFEELITKSTVPILIDFYADWCGPCKMIVDAKVGAMPKVQLKNKLDILI